MSSPVLKQMDEDYVEYLNAYNENRLDNDGYQDQAATPASYQSHSPPRQARDPFGSSGSVSSQLRSEPSGYTSLQRSPVAGEQFTSSPSLSSHSPSVGFYEVPAYAHNTSLSVLKYRKPFAKRIMAAGETPYKPWLESKQRKKSDRKAYFVFLAMVCLGIAAAAVMMYTAYAEVPRDKYCLVLEDNFDGNAINTDIWHHEIETGGFGNGQFDWTTDSTNNSYVEDGKLYSVPTLTSDAVGEEAIVNGYTLNLTSDGRCTALNKTDPYCAVASNSTTGTILPPAQSARLTTNFSTHIRYGRVEVRAKMPTGDWLWPAIWMMPRDNVYGEWPRSGEIDIMESKGNLPQKRSDTVANAMKSTLHFGPNWMFDGYSHAADVRWLWRKYYNQEFRTFGLEWTEEGIYTWETSPVYKVLIHKFKKDFWEVGKFPPMMANGTVLTNPWSTAENTNIAPFDQYFYLILNVAVGGTNGYFEDDRFDKKPWSNNADNARSDFWNARSRWLPTWPTDPKERGMVVDSVKMWQKC